MEREEELQYIADFYGLERQFWQCIEEVGELLQAINKLNRAETLEDKYVAMQNIQEELGDVDIIIQQLKLLCGKKAVEQSIDYKIHRELERIKSKSTGE